MQKRTLLRGIGFGMLVIAVIFVFCAIACPTMGQVFSIGNMEIGPEIWRAFYAVYVGIMAAMFVASFLVKQK